MTEKDITSAITSSVSVSGKERKKRDIGHVGGRVDTNKMFTHKAKNVVNRVLEDGLPNMVRDNCRKLLGDGIGNWVADTVLSAFDRIGYGNANKNRNGYSSQTPYYSYSSPRTYYYTTPVTNYQQVTQQSPVAASAVDINFQEVTTMRDMASARDLLDMLNAAIRTSGSVSVAELFDCLGLEDDYTFNYFGWKNLDAVQIRRNAYGWWLDLPKPISLG